MLNEQRNPLHVYGIKNCDTCRSTLKWLETRKVPHTFHDFRVAGLSEELLKDWLASSHAPYLVNKRSTTWRNLSDTEKQVAVAGNDADLMALLLANPTLIKRPVITDGKTILDIGFSPSHLDDYI
jgi:arsenate reductase